MGFSPVAGSCMTNCAVGECSMGFGHSRGIGG